MSIDLSITFALSQVNQQIHVFSFDESFLLLTHTPDPIYLPKYLQPSVFPRLSKWTLLQFAGEKEAVLHALIYAAIVKY